MDTNERGQEQLVPDSEDVAFWQQLGQPDRTFDTAAEIPLGFFYLV
jgi:hypothetical protein